MPRSPRAEGVAYTALFDGGVPPQPVDDASVGELLRCSMGLSAWKAYQQVRWALRVNPSSGNLHPTETYLIRSGRVFHYAPDAHALEERSVLGDDAWRTFTCGEDGVLVGLTTITWREAWKYGERAFRYCHHDLGHALGALRYAAAMMGWRACLLSGWADAQVARLLGTDRDPDDSEADREEAACLVAVTRADPVEWLARDPGPLVAAATSARWQGTASRLSPARIEWPIVDDVERATRYPGLSAGAARAGLDMSSTAFDRVPATTALPRGPAAASATESPLAREVILRRRSAVAFDARSSLPRATFLRMLQRLDPVGTPWDVLAGGTFVHLAVFVHRVEGITPGLYAYLRTSDVQEQWRSVMRPEFLWEPVADSPRLFLLVPADVSWPAKRVSCDQDIAGDGFFSLGMLAPVDAVLAEHGEWMYRRLFWECGVLGQVLYLEAEAAGARGTGIGCFYDDAVHELLGLLETGWRSLYHFSMGAPVDDGRLTTEPGYPWEGLGLRS